MTVKSVKIFKSKIIKNKKGNLIKYISNKDSFFRRFGEVYFNEINPKTSKGWIQHKRNTCLIKCLQGKVKFHLIDKNDKQLKILLNSKKGEVLMIPPKIWFSFKAFEIKSIIVNLIERAHSDKEVNKKNKIKKYLIN